MGAVIVTGTSARDIFKAWEEAKQRRSEEMPTETEALTTAFSAWQRLKELGWREIMYCPKDGTRFQSISAGSTGIHISHYTGRWPDGSWWTEDGGDLWPGRPILFKLMEGE